MTATNEDYFAYLRRQEREEQASIFEPQRASIRRLLSCVAVHLEYESWFKQDPQDGHGAGPYATADQNDTRNIAGAAKQLPGICASEFLRDKLTPELRRAGKPYPTRPPEAQALEPLAEKEDRP